MPISSRLKRCKWCNEMWPADREFYHRSGGTRSGLHNWCKACITQYNKSRRGVIFEPPRPTHPVRSAAMWRHAIMSRVRMYFIMNDLRRKREFEAWCVFKVIG